MSLAAPEEGAFWLRLTKCLMHSPDRALHKRDVALACDFDWTLDTFVSFLLIFVSFLLIFVPKYIPGEIHTKFVNGAIAILLTLGLREVRIVLRAYLVAGPPPKEHTA